MNPITAVVRTQHCVVKHPEKDLYWGVVYADGPHTVDGWGPIDTAYRHSLGLEDPTKITWNGARDADELGKGSIVILTVTITYDVTAS